MKICGLKEMFAKLVPDQGRVLRPSEECFDRKRVYVKIWAEVFHSRFPKEEKEMANRKWKKCSLLFLLGKCKLKIRCDTTYLLKWLEKCDKNPVPWGNRTIWPFVHCLWECKVVPSLWKMAYRWYSYKQTIWPSSKIHT